MSLAHAIEWRGVECPTCGVIFAVLAAFFDARVADRSRFSCPNGHPVQLGVEHTTDRMLRAYAEANARQAGELARLQEDFERLVSANLRLVDDNVRLQSTVVDRLVGPATAEEGA